MGNNQHDIFISYAREDQSQAQRLARALEEQDWSVWWDLKLRPGERFDEVIEQVIDSSGCVIVIWSSHSVKSRYVKDEAAYALDLNKLVPISIEAVENVKIPFRFRGLHTPSLSNWDGARNSYHFTSLVEAIADLLGAKPKVTSTTPEVSNKKPLKTNSKSPEIQNTEITRLIQIMQSEDRPAKERLEAGLKLDSLGWRSDDLDEFVAVEPGTFLYGHDNKTQTINHRYWIAKYPVTNSQYTRFLATGYHKPNYWGDTRFNNTLAPVVGVSWDDARAYCQWLNELIKKEGFQVASSKERMPDGYVVRLPTEEEWERAARGTDGREYPWGSEFKASCANTDESELKRTTPVCTYPSGVSPVGAWDMAGNVWEWTASKADRWRVMRGGSWFNDSWAARGAIRNWYDPGFWDADWGLRVVVSLANSDF